MKIKWQKEVRTEFEDAVAAAQAAQVADPGLYAMAKLQEALAMYDFPLLLAAEWGPCRSAAEHARFPRCQSGPKNQNHVIAWRDAS